VTAVRAAVRRALEEDLGPLGDITTALLPEPHPAVAHLVPRSDGVLAGRLAAAEAFAAADPSVAVEWRADDGAEVGPGEIVAVVEGELASILVAERTVLNFLCHLSGIATLTRRYVRAARGRSRILDTRKTTPGLRALEKAAVRAGGGVNHRGNLSELVLLKDNHLAVLAIDDAVRRARMRWPGRAVEVECDSRAQAEAAAAAGADMVLLDNMPPSEVRACVDALAKAEHRPLVEVSGTVEVQTVSAYADAGADLISVGALTHSAPVLDIGLDVVSSPRGRS
jgi:nicotinate-nucleotide pyrophosphorylase (carboxylating)